MSDLRKFLKESDVFGEEDITSSYRPDSKNKLSRHKVKGGAIDLRTRDKSKEDVMREANRALKSNMEVEVNTTKNAPHLHLGSANLGRSGRGIIKDEYGTSKFDSKNILKALEHENRMSKPSDESQPAQQFKVPTLSELTMARDNYVMQTGEKLPEEEDVKEMKLGMDIMQTTEGKQIVKQMVNSDPNLNRYQKKKIIEESSDPVKVSNRIIDKSKQELGNKNPDLLSKFQESLAYFLPTIAATGLGAIFGGSEAAYAAGTTAQQMTKDFNDFQLTKAQATKNIENVNKKQIDVTSFVDNNGNPVKIDKQTGEVTDLSGNKVDPKNITHATTFRQSRSIGQRDEESEAIMERFAKKYDLDKTKAAQLSDAQVKDMGSLDVAINSLDRIEKIYKDVNTGPFASRGQSFMQMFDAAPEKFTMLQSELGSTVNNYIKAITGAQMSEPEAQRIKAVAPDMNDDDKTFETKLKVFSNIMRKHKEDVAKAISSGQKLKQSTINSMLKEIESATGNTNILKRRTKDGKIAIFDKETKEFLRYENE